MHIGIDASCWSNPRGFGRFTRELVSRMVGDFTDHRFTLVVDRQTDSMWTPPARAAVEVVATGERPTLAASDAGARRLADVWRMSRAASRVPCDVFFFPAVYSFYPLVRRVPTIVAFHDAIAEEYPELVFSGPLGRFLWRLKTTAASFQADRLVTVSESAKARVREAFSWDDASIRVVSEAPSAIFEVRDDPGSDAGVRRRYGLPAAHLLLYVGGLSPHKNLSGLVGALARLRDRHDWHLVLVGDPDDVFRGDAADIVREVARAGLGPRVTFTGYVPDAELVRIYNAATVLVMPSFSEGFGLPVVEAMACGLPVAASRRGSLPEVVGTAGVLFDPADPADMARVMAGLLDDPQERARLRVLGRERVRTFSWTAAAETTVRLCEELHGQPAP